MNSLEIKTSRFLVAAYSMLFAGRAVPLDRLQRIRARLGALKDPLATLIGGHKAGAEGEIHAAVRWQHFHRVTIDGAYPIGRGLLSGKIRCKEVK